MAGTANATTAQYVGLWTGSGLRTGTQTFRASEQLDLRARHVRDDDELHADRSLVRLRFEKATTPERNLIGSVPATFVKANW